MIQREGEEDEIPIFRRQVLLWELSRSFYEKRGGTSRCLFRFFTDGKTLSEYIKTSTNWT